jgi:hypothetical protein
VIDKGFYDLVMSTIFNFPIFFVLFNTCLFLLVLIVKLLWWNIDKKEEKSG